MSIKLMSRLIFFIILLSVSACSSNNVMTHIKSADIAPFKPAAAAPIQARQSTGFQHLASDRRIAFQAGAKQMALNVQRYLDEKAAIVARRQYARFSKPINVFVLNSEQSAKRFCASRLARGCVVNQRLFVTKRAKGTLPQLIQHELSHLHLEQRLGMYRHHSEIPAWFQEGLAVFVSDGAGAEKATFASAINGLRSNKSITPNARRSLLFPKKAAQFGLTNAMFYTQSGIFVKYLHHQNPTKFKRLVTAISRGNAFAPSIRAIYGRPLRNIWLGFKSEVATSNLTSLRRYSLR